MKSVVNRKAILVSLSLIFIIVLIALTSLANAGIDPEYWKSQKFLNDMIFTVALVLIGIVIGQAEGDNFYRNSSKGLFQSSYNGYNIKRNKIDPYVDKFSSWNKHLYEKEYYEKCLRYLFNDNGIKQAKLILQLDRTEIVQLENCPQTFKIEGVDRYFNSLTKAQIDAIMNVLDGKIKIRYVHDSYFLNAYAKNNNKTMYEQASIQDKLRRKKFVMLMTYRVIFTVLIGMVLTAFVIEQSEETNKLQSVITLLSRYFTLFSSVSWGFFIANDMIKDECVFLDYKSTTLEQFYLEVEVNKTFEAKTDEEIAYEKITALLKEGEINGTDSTNG